MPGQDLRQDGQLPRRRRRTGGLSAVTGPAAPGRADATTRQSVRKAAVSMLVAATMLLVFNSAGLRTWAHGLPGNAATDMLVAGVDGWHRLMQRAGLAGAMTAVQDAVAAFRDQGWPDADMLSARKTHLANDD